MNEQTSVTHPLRLDCLPPGLLPVRGRLGLTLAPGKRAPGLGGFWHRDLRADLERLREVYQVSAIVDLLEDHEHAMLGIPEYIDEVHRFGVELGRLPIPDGGTPHDVAATRALVRWIVERLERGATVAIHCRAGLGRSGMVAACCLTTFGLAPEDAIRAVRGARPGAIENAPQEAFVRRFAGG